MVGTGDEIFFAEFQSFVKARGLKIFNQNVCGLVRVLDHIKILLHKFKEIDIFGVSESHLNSKIDNEELKIPGYEIDRLDRNNGTGGGAAVYFRDHLPSDKKLAWVQSFCCFENERTENRKTAHQKTIVRIWQNRPIVIGNNQKLVRNLSDRTSLVKPASYCFLLLPQKHCLHCTHENKMANRSSGAKIQWDEDKFRESLLAVSSFFK